MDNYIFWQIRESAYEILTNKLKAAHESAQQDNNKVESQEQRSTKGEKSTVEKVLTSTTAKQVGRTVARELTRGILGVLGVGGSSSRRKKSWF